MLNVYLKFLIMLRVYSKLTKFANVALGLRYRHNNFKSLGLLIEFLENYSELLINLPSISLLRWYFPRRY